jgi:hypothetical protein
MRFEIGMKKLDIVLEDAKVGIGNNLNDNSKEQVDWAMKDAANSVLNRLQA